MRDWRQIVHRRLTGLRLCKEQKDSVLEELSTHLEEAYSSQLRSGVMEAKAAENALNLVENWKELSAEICAAKNEEGPVNYRTRAIWVPGLISLTVSMLWLMFLLRLEWQPRHTLNTSMPPITPYLLWLVAQPLIGALGAYLSLKGSGNRRARVIAGLFPAIVLFGLMIVAAWSAFWVEKNSYVMHHPVHFALGVVPWVVIPAATLLIGVLPMCWSRSTRARAEV